MELRNKVEQMTIEEVRVRLEELTNLRLEAIETINHEVETRAKQIAIELGLEENQVNIYYNNIRHITVNINYSTHNLGIELSSRYDRQADTPEISVRSTSFELPNSRKDEALEFLRVLTIVTSRQEELINTIKTKTIIDASNLLEDTSAEISMLNRKVNDFNRAQSEKVVKESIDSNPVLTFAEMETIKEHWRTVENRRGEPIIRLRIGRNEVLSLEVIKRFPKGDYKVKITTEPNYWGETTKEEYMTKSELETLFKKVRKLEPAE